MDVVTSSELTPEGRKMSQPESPRRPMNAFMLFRRDSPEVQRAMSSDTKKYSQSEQSALAGELWQAMSNAERAPWTRAAEEVKREHRLKYPDYRYQPKKLKTSSRRSRAKRFSAQRREDQASVAKVGTTPEIDAGGVKASLRTSARAGTVGPVLSPNQPPHTPSVRVSEYDPMDGYRYMASPLRTDPLHMGIPIKIPHDVQPADPRDDFDYSQYLHEFDVQPTATPPTDTSSTADIQTVRQLSFPAPHQLHGSPLTSSALDVDDRLALGYRPSTENIYRQYATSAGTLNINNCRDIKLSEASFDELYPRDAKAQDTVPRCMDSDAPYYGPKLRRESLPDLESWFQTGSDEQYGM